MADFLQLVIAGLATGAIYALSAIGFTLLWQASQTINFAQGEFVMLPPFFALAAMKWLNLPFSVACLLAIALAMLILGALFKTVIVDPLIERGVLPLVISTIALALFPFILEATHFVTRDQNQGQIFLNQPAEAIVGLKALGGLIPGAAMLIGALILVWFPLRGAYLQKVQREVLEMHARKHAQRTQS